MLNEVQIETWERRRTHRISLSLHEVEQILHALKQDPDYPDCDFRYEALANRMERLRRKMIGKYRA